MTYPQRPPGRLIAIGSGKGGVGKTWLAVTLAHVLARAGRRVVLLDADLGLANVDIQLGLTPRYDLGDVLAGKASLAEALTEPAGTGFRVLAGRSGHGGLAGLPAARLESLIAPLLAEAELVLLDLGAGIDRAMRQLAARADILAVVTTEEPTSLTDSYAVLKLFQADRPGGDARVIVNLASSEAAARRTFTTLAEVSQRFLGAAPAYAGAVRRDRAVPEAIRRQQPLLLHAAQTSAARDVSALAARLTPAR
jgi:flagellar biosynthesis protein FlhG